MGVEPWSALEAWLTHEQFKGYLLGTALGYLARVNASGAGKGGRLDVEKASHVLEKLLEIWSKDLDKQTAQEQYQVTPADSPAKSRIGPMKYWEELEKVRRYLEDRQVRMPDVE
jgi:hypothetical protein